MKKIFTLLVVAVLLISSVFAFAACSGVDATEDLARVQERGVLRVGMECNYAPFNWTQDDNSNGAVPIKNISGKYANGFDVSIAKEVAEGLEVELEVYKIEWNGLIPALEAGTIDAIIAGMSPREDRKESIDFSSNYYVSTLVVVVLKEGNLATATSLEDLMGKNIAAQRGTVHADVLIQLEVNPSDDFTVPDAKLFKTFPLLVNALQINTIEGYVAEEPVAAAHCDLFSDLMFIPLVNNETGFEVTNDDVAIAVGLRKNSSLTVEVNAIIDALSQSVVDNFMVQAAASQPAE